MNELIIKTDLHLGEVIHNFEEPEKQITTEMKRYKGLLFEDQDIKDAKATRATLNSLRKQIEDRRIAIKRQWNEPYDAFEKKAKDIVAIIDEPIGEIDAQIKDFETRRKEEKRQAIGDLITETVARQEDEEFENFVRDCSWIYDPKWENASVPLSTVAREFDAKITYIKQAIGILDDQSKHAGQLLGSFKECGNLTEVLNLKKQLETRDREYAEKLARDEQAREAHKAELKRIAEEKSQWIADPPKPAPQAEITLPVTAREPETEKPAEPIKILTAAFRVEGTLTQHQALVAFLKSSNMRFERIKE